MIITCNNCNKKFDIDSSIIPEKGRLLQCNGCNHKWFFRKKIINKPIIPIKTNKTTDETEVYKKDEVPLERGSSKTIELLDKSIKNNFVIEKISIKDEDKKNEDKNLKINSSKNKKNYNILGLIIVSIISFIALIIVLDSFQTPISKIIPNIEFLLYNLYETINDIELFFRDLI